MALVPGVTATPVVVAVVAPMVVTLVPQRIRSGRDGLP